MHLFFVKKPLSQSVQTEATQFWLWCCFWMRNSDCRYAGCSCSRCMEISMFHWNWIV